MKQCKDAHMIHKLFTSNSSLNNFALTQGQLATQNIFGS